MAELKLLGVSLSPFSRRVEWALKIKGVEYEFVEEELQNKSPLLLESNPIHKKIPVLIHNGKPICESMIIVEYIDETFEGPFILPKDPYDRAIARFWAKFFDEKCMPVMGKALFGSGEESDKAKEELGELIKILENELKDKKFFVGDKFGFADMAGNLMAYWMAIVEEASGNVFVTSEKFPIFCAWRDEYANCSPIKEHFPPREALLAHFNARFQAAAAASASK
ncbi:putative glutathione S-transferase [Capsicum annuum]|uniref:Probable glutathione S-transferase n=1 Tax=Capsicum annuum TaxID=4072 RepID=A0A1U8E7F1_CAPAN|nr:probable glutathione S-transferase [Capsicum annuum]KAF3684697.1 putative glutathione S-transferase [Capsicum annuum]KAF3685907.1 putative glutathione S-transferase [Capsicum annuum]PHT72286.1 putative glutathione S-transferase [Capsicum annuum]